MQRDSPADFGFRTLCGNFLFSASQITDPAPRHGLIRDGQYVYGGLRDAEGVLHGFLRKIELNRYSQSFSAQNNADRVAMRIARGTVARMFSGPVKIDRSDDKVAFSPHRVETEQSRRRINRPEQNSFSLTMSPREVQWQEENTLEIRGEPVGPGMQWYTPYPGGGALYLSQGYKAEGSIEGKPVRGFVFFDQFYVPHGIAWTRDPFILDLLLRWHSFGNWYEDGTVELGHFGFGHEQWGFALVNDQDGVVHATNELTCHISERDSDQFFPLRIDTVVAGEKWIWTADPAGEMVDLARTLNPNSAGRERREGETRKLVTWMSWGETCPLHGDERRPGRVEISTE